MKCEKILYGEEVSLRQIRVEDCTETYHGWLNDERVNQYLETKWQDQSLNLIKEFVNEQIEDPNTVMFAIIYNKTEMHIGNIKLGPIHERYKHADVSYLIGNTDYWNKGIATEAIGLVCNYGFENLKLHKIEAGTYSCAIGSQRALEKNGFKREGVLRKEVYFNDDWIDVFLYGLLSADFKAKEIRNGNKGYT